MRKILFITNNKLLPNNNGAVIYTYGILKYLKKIGYTIDLLSFFEDKDYENYEIKELSSYVNQIYSLQTKKRFILFNLSFCKPITIKKYIFRSVRVALTKLNNEKEYDIVIYDHLHMSTYYNIIKAKQHIIVEHNIEYNVWRSYYENTKGFLKKILVRWQLNLMKNYEISMIEKIKNVILISEIDKDVIQEKIKDANMCVFKPYLHIKQLKDETSIRYTNNAIIFIGSYSWFPNQVAARYLAKVILPRLQKINKDIKLYLIGNKPTKEMLSYKDNKNVIVTGRVKSVDEYILNSDVFINHITSGSGLNIKLLEAIAKGIPVVTTKFGGRGFELIDNYHVMIYSDLEEQINQILEIINNPDKRVQLAYHARSYYEKIISDNSALQNFLLDFK